MESFTYGNSKAAIRLTEILTEFPDRSLSRRWSMYSTTMKAIHKSKMDLRIKNFLFDKIFIHYRDKNSKELKVTLLNNIMKASHVKYLKLCQK